MCHETIRFFSVSSVKFQGHTGQKTWWNGSNLGVLGTLKRMHDMMASSNGNIIRVTGPLCEEFTGPGEFPTQRPETRSFDVFFYLRLNKRLSKQPWGWWFDTPSGSLWRHGDEKNSRIFDMQMNPDHLHNWLQSVHGLLVFLIFALVWAFVIFFSVYYTDREFVQSDTTTTDLKYWNSWILEHLCFYGY